MNKSSVIVVSKPYYSNLAAMLAKSFADDPVMAYIFPQQLGRLQNIESIMHLAIRAYSAHGLIESIGGHSGAIWQRPSPVKPSFLTLLINSIEAICRLRGALERAQQVQRITARARLKQPHWYLAVIGTEPGYRGQWQGGPSLASQLLQSVLHRCDQQQLPAYLESSNEANIGFYQRFGFTVTEVLPLPEGPSMWGMVRQPN